MTINKKPARKDRTGCWLFRPDFLEHDPEKWKPVFRKDHAQTRRWTMSMIQLS